VQKNPTLLIVAAIALVAPDRRVLLQKRPEGRPMSGLWEFPGGKLEDGECPEIALARELSEELDISVAVEDLTPACFASEPLGERQLLLLLYRCDRWVGIPHAVEQQEIGWFHVTEMPDLNMPPADYPLIELLEKLL
jgi:8-oxo-dGTP diphosphatase